jgi:hypothetical protein
MQQGFTFPKPTFENIASATNSDQSFGKTANHSDKLNAGPKSTDPLTANLLQDKKFDLWEDLRRDAKILSPIMSTGDRSPERDNAVSKGEQKSREESIPPKKTEASDKSDPK